LTRASNAITKELIWKQFRASDMRKWWLFGALGVVVAGGVYGGSPYFAASNLRETAAKGDADALYPSGGGRLAWVGSERS
jgi:hypothetical protein